MKLVTLILGLGTIVLLLSILLPTQKHASDTEQDNTIVINIQPLDGIDTVDPAAFVKLYIEPLGVKNAKVVVLPHKNSPESVYNSAKTRYSAKKLVDYLSGETPDGTFTIGVTDKDISTAVHGYDDYGVLGLSFLGNRKKACITSTFRLKNKADLWKLMAHEFTHGYFSQPHCKRDAEHCIMMDAKGKSPGFEKKEYLCDECLKEVQEKIKHGK